MGWALGVVTSAVALGSAIGPVIGGLAAEFLGLRLVFLAGGVLLALSLIPVLWIVRESPLPPRVGPRVSTLALLDQQPGLRRSLSVLTG